ncbi:MAG: 3-methyl-2-oxobutanoate hydroxymethyltransferase [Coriobacteriia bacterium]|nr:3-methyl-2-oxobutanoate hydroxymethyltransferase [Coriobacteriia bacterium]
MAKETVLTLLAKKAAGEKISQMTCYDYTMARLEAAAGVETILVGDSLGMTMQGYPDTLSVTMEEMIVYARSVVRGAPECFVIVDMPFMSYQVSVEQAVANAGRLIKETGANAVKLEGGAAVKEQIKAIVDCGIPVCAHVGMTPQSANAFGGFKVQGKDEASARRVLQDAFDVQEAGAFMCVLECVPATLARIITQKTRMVTIGIGAGPDCDGQVLVAQDALAMGVDGFRPKFVKHFAQVGECIQDGVRAYVEDVKAGTYPSEEFTYAKSDLGPALAVELEAAF